jgi:hypothetical protein
MVRRVRTGSRETGSREPGVTRWGRVRRCQRTSSTSRSWVRSGPAATSSGWSWVAIASGDCWPRWRWTPGGSSPPSGWRTGSGRMARSPRTPVGRSAPCHPAAPGVGPRFGRHRVGRVPARAMVTQVGGALAAPRTGTRIGAPFPMSRGMSTAGVDGLDPAVSGLDEHVLLSRRGRLVRDRLPGRRPQPDHRGVGPLGPRGSGLSTDLRGVASCGIAVRVRRMTG